MALLRARIRREPLHPRHFSSSSSSSPFPAPPPEPASADPAPRSPFADIRDRLRSTASASASSPRSAPPIDDIHRSLRQFAKSNPSTSAAPHPSSSAASSSPAPSFLDVFSSAPSSASSSAPSPGRLDFRSLRESLGKPGSAPGGLPAPGARKFDWKSLAPRREAAFGRGLREDPGAMGLEFLRHYNYDDLGKRLGDSRPAGAGKDGFSLEELSARLGRLREMDKQEGERAALLPGMGKGVLREALLGLGIKDKKRTAAVPSMSAMMGFGAQTFSGKPQEELMERYFHPDHMSSAEKMKLELKRVRDEFKMSENDCGSARVQVAQLTTKIKHLSATLHENRLPSFSTLLLLYIAAPF